MNKLLSFYSYCIDTTEDKDESAYLHSIHHTQLWKKEKQKENSGPIG